MIKNWKVELLGCKDFEPVYFENEAEARDFWKTGIDLKKYGFVIPAITRVQ